MCSEPRRIFVEKVCGRFLLVLALSFLTAAAASTGWAADKYPNKPINMVLGFAPGGASDLAATILGEKLAQALGQPLVNIYKPGGAGVLAASFVRRAKPDGYTVLLLVESMFLPPEGKELEYKTDDFSVVGLFTKVPYFFAVQASSRWKNLKDFVDEAKKNPGKLSFGTTGTNIGGYFVASLFQKHADIRLTFVPFKSCGEVMTALLGGHVDAFSCAGGGGVSETSLVRTLAIAENTRLPSYPTMPTFLENGYPVKYTARHYLAFPKGTPEEVLKKFSQAMSAVMKDSAKEIGERLVKADMWPDYMDPRESTVEFKRNIEVGLAIIKDTRPGKKGNK